MRSVRQQDTKPELAVRRAVHALGLRFRKNTKPIPGIRSRADLVFVRVRVAVYIDGCFWHGCPEHGTRPKSNEAFWANKIAANIARDRRVDEALSKAGWAVLRTWEHEEPGAAAKRIEALVRQRSREIA